MAIWHQFGDLHRASLFLRQTSPPHSHLDTLMAEAYSNEHLFASVEQKNRRPFQQQKCMVGKTFPTPSVFWTTKDLNKRPTKGRKKMGKNNNFFSIPARTMSSKRLEILFRSAIVELCRFEGIVWRFFRWPTPSQK